MWYTVRALNPRVAVSAQPNPNAEPILELSKISKSLGNRAVLTNVDLTVHPGELVVLLGPNGAGKTTLLGTACGRIAPDSGSVQLLGADPRRRAQARSALGYVPQELALYPYLSVRENLEVFGRLMGLPASRLPERVAEALDWSRLTDRASHRVDTLSGGMRRRLNIVASLLHEPRMLMLDEPTVGVDVNARERIHELLRLLRARGLGVLLTTHDLDQATTLADRVVFLLDGKVRLEGEPAALITSEFGECRELLVTFARTPSATQAQALIAQDLRASAGSLTWSGRVAGAPSDLGGWGRNFAALELEVAELRIREPNLESVFLRVTGEALKL